MQCSKLSISIFVFLAEPYLVEIIHVYQVHVQKFSFILKYAVNLFCEEIHIRLWLQFLFLGMFVCDLELVALVLNSTQILA